MPEFLLNKSETRTHQKEKSLQFDDFTPTTTTYKFTSNSFSKMHR